MSCEVIAVVDTKTVTDVVKDTALVEVTEQQIVVEVKDNTDLVEVREFQDVTEVVEQTAVVEVVTAGPQGPRGPAGAGAFVIVHGKAVAGITAGQAVAVKPTGFEPASADALDHAMTSVGIATSSVLPGGDLDVMLSGEFENAGYAFTAGAPLFLGTSGALTHTPDTDAFTLPVGIAMHTTKILVRVGTPVIRS